MKRTPEEILQYIKDEKLELVMLCIAINNSRGYTYRQVEIDRFKQENGRWYAHVQENGWLEVDPVEGKNMDRINHHLQYVNAMVIGHHVKQNDQEVIFLYSYGDNRQDALDKMMDSLFLDMIDYFEIRTKGKIGVLAEEADNIARTNVVSELDQLSFVNGLRF